MRCFCDSKMDQGFFQVSSFQPTRKSPRHMLQKRGPCLARHTSTSAGGSPAADSPDTPDKREARADLGSGSDASAALAALGGGPALQSSSITG